MSSHEQEFNLKTSLDENCREFEFQTDRIYNVDLRQMYLAPELKLVKGRGYDAYNTKENKKEQNGESIAAAEAGESKEEEEEDATVPLVTHADSILQSFFSKVEVYINHQPI